MRKKLMQAFQSLTEAWEESSPRNKTSTERADSRNGHIALAVIVKRHVRKFSTQNFQHLLLGQILGKIDKPYIQLLASITNNIFY